VKLLADAGIVSAYHTFTHEERGSESRKTQFMYRQSHRGYHIDYVFVPNTWTVSRVKIGDYEKWRGLSDHYPVVVDIQYFCPGLTNTASATSRIDLPERSAPCCAAVQPYTGSPGAGRSLSDRRHPLLGF
jgi:hypothetical protein